MSSLNDSVSSEASPSKGGEKKESPLEKGGLLGSVHLWGGDNGRNLCSRAWSLGRYPFLALGMLKETIFRRGNVFGSLHHGSGRMGKWGEGQGNGNAPWRKVSLERPILWGGGKVMESSILVMGTLSLEVPIPWAG